MDIHAPDKPVHSFKDFAVHIAIVTVGILIALALDGAREAFRERRLVRETRESIHEEMVINLEHADDEMRQVTRYNERLKSLVAQMPALAQQHPEQITAQLADNNNPGYFFLSISPRSAVSTGAVTHMSTDEAITYGSATQIIEIYSQMQNDTKQKEDSAKAFFAAHPHPDAAQVEEGTERLLIFAKAEETLAHVVPQLKNQLQRAEEATTSH